jgi:hypothetical protein
MHETIPMDLATFFWFHITQGITLEGTLFAWKDIETTGSSLRDASFDEMINDYQKELLKEDVTFSGILDHAQHNRGCSNAIREYLKQDINNFQLASNHIESIINSHQILLRSVEYYLSRHHLMEMLFQTYNNLDCLNHHNDYHFLIKAFNELAISPTYEEDTAEFLIYVPHKQLTNGVLACIAHFDGYTHLLPNPKILPCIDKEDIRFLLTETDYHVFSEAVSEYADSSIKQDKPLLFNCIEAVEQHFRLADVVLQTDKTFVIQALERNGLALEYISKEFRADKEVVLTAVRNNGSALEYASEELKADREVVLEAVRKNGRALEYASGGLKQDAELRLLAESNIAEDDQDLPF